jgi:8-oxo-dGTP pyrophosphatase MutT (NUDIX family)
MSVVDKSIPEFRTAPWGENFTHEYYFSLIDTLGSGRELHTFSGAADLVHSQEIPIGLIRHDIDFSPSKALELASKEADRDIRATYFVLPNGEDYDISDAKAAKQILSIADDYGHEIGLHYNPSAWLRQNVTDVRDLEADISAQAAILEEVIDMPVNSMSFHRPGARHPTWLNGPTRLAGLVNAYAGVFMSPAEAALYTTDSTGVWRYGEPLRRIQSANGVGARVIQVVTHAEWWNAETQNGSLELTPKARGAGAIFHISDTDQFMFFLRDDKDSIPSPNMIDIIGGHMEDGETPEETAMREFAEELDDLDTGQPFRPTGLVHFRTWVDNRNVEQNIFGCELETTPNLRLNEGQRLVFLNREQIRSTTFAFDYDDIVREYAATV